MKQKKILLCYLQNQKTKKGSVFIVSYLWQSGPKSGKTASKWPSDRSNIGTNGSRPQQQNAKTARIQIILWTLAWKRQNADKTNRAIREEMRWIKPRTGESKRNRNVVHLVIPNLADWTFDWSNLNQFGRTQLQLVFDVCTEFRLKIFKLPKLLWYKQNHTLEKNWLDWPNWCLDASGLHQI